VRFGIGVGEHVAVVEDGEDEVVGCVLVVECTTTLELEVDDFFAAGDAAAAIKRFVLAKIIYSPIFV